MVNLRSRFVAPSIVLAGLFGFIGSAPAHAADYTIDCNQTPAAPYVDYDADPAIYYGVWDYSYDGTQDQTVTVNILNCGYHFVRDHTGTIAEGYKGQSANETYTMSVPIDGMADVWGYNIWDNPQRTTFIINMNNPAPSGGGGGGGGGEEESGGGSGEPEASSNSLPETGFDTSTAVSFGLFALISGFALALIRRRRIAAR